MAFFKTSFLHGRSKAHGAGRKEGRDDDAGEMAASEESDAMKQFKELQVNPRTSPPRESFSFTRGSPARPRLLMSPPEISVSIIGAASPVFPADLDPDPPPFTVEIH